MAAGDVALKSASDTLNSNAKDSTTITASSNHALTGAFIHSCAPEVSLTNVVVAAAGATMTLYFDVKGPGTNQWGDAVTYPVVVHATEIDVSA